MVAAVENHGYARDSHAVLLMLDSAESEPSHAAIAVANGSTLVSVSSASQLTAYVLWPATARLLLEALPLDVPVPVFIARHIAERKLISFMASPALTVAAPVSQGSQP